MKKHLKSLALLAIFTLTMSSCLVEQVVLYKQEAYVVTEKDRFLATCTGDSLKVKVRHFNILNVGDTLISFRPYSSLIVYKKTNN